MTLLLDELRKHSTIDLDWNDDAVALKYKPLQDMTSNQLVVLGQYKQPSHQAIFISACEKALRNKDDFPGVDLSDLAVDYATVFLGKIVAQHLQPEGYVHAQTNPSLVHDTVGTIEHALRLVKIYGLEQIPRSRVCIKIPATAPGLVACSELEKTHDVRTLATICFTIAQGLAAARSGCTYVAPYVNPLVVHVDPSQHVAFQAL